MSETSNRFACVAATALTASLALPVVTNAQVSTPASPPQAAPDVEEIIVTAQRRPEALERVPVAISVVGPDTLKANNINNAENLEEVVPSLTFKRGTTNLNSTLAIRGIGTQSFSSGAEPSVSTIVDGVVYGRSGMAFQEFADIDRIEVLRGPQGMLFGKNASAGALNILTRDPSDNFNAEGSAGWYQGGEYRATTTVSGPLTDTIRGIISGVYGDYKGNALNVYNGEYVNGYRREGARAKLVGEFGNVKLSLVADYMYANDRCCADVLGTVIPNAQQVNLFLPEQLPNVPGSKNFNVNNNFNPGTHDSNGGLALQADVILGDYTLTSITAWRNWFNEQLRDADFGSASSTYVASGDVDERDDGKANFNQYSEELRIASPTGRQLEYVAGVFLWGTSENDTFLRSTAECSASTLPADATGFQPCSTAPGVSTFNFSEAPAAWDTHFHSYAGFGNATYNLTEQLRLIAGARYTKDSVSFDYNRTLIGPLAPGLSASFAAAEEATDSGWSGRTGVQYQVMPTVMTYATASRGYKGSSLNDFYSMNANSLGAIAPETSWDYELGIKSQLLDRRLTLNLAAFWENFENFQANSFTTLQNGFVTVSLNNAGDVRTRGFEMEFTYNVIPGLNFSGGYTFDDASILHFRCAASLTGANLTTCLDHDGRPLPFAPRNKADIAGNWTLPFSGRLPFDVDFGSTLSYTGFTNYDIDQTPLARQPAYALLGATLSFSSKDDRYRVSLLGKNLTDRFYTTFITPQGNGVAAGSFARLQVPRDAERYFGVQGTVKF